jgi:hypothetical protein
MNPPFSGKRITIKNPPPHLLDPSKAEGSGAPPKCPFMDLGKFTVAVTYVVAA